MQFQILPQRPQDSEPIEPLLDRTFGRDRKGRTTYRLRDGVPPLDALSFVAIDEAETLLGSIRFWPVAVETMPAILLGPLAVEPSLQGRGVGRALVRHGLTEARRLGHGLCLVVGPPEYYAPFGFRSAMDAGLVMPGPVDPARFQVLELIAGTLTGVAGLVRPAVQGDCGETRRGGGTAA